MKKATQSKYDANFHSEHGATNRKNDMESASSEENRLKAFLSESPFPILFLDSNLIITNATPCARTIFEADSSNYLVGSSFAEIVAFGERDIFADFLENTPNYPASRKENFRLKTVSGVGRFAMLHASKWCSTEEQGSCFIVSIATEPTQVEMALSRSEKLLRQAETEKQHIQAQLIQAQKMETVGRLTGGITHDFNNLLMVITGYSDLVMKRMGVDSPFRDDIDEIHSAARRAAAITRQLLAFSRRKIVQKKVLDLNRIVEEMQSLLRYLIGEDITLHSQSSPTPTQVKADPAQLEQVILNLAVNARDAMPRGGKLTIRVENVLIKEKECRNYPGARGGEMVCLTFKDTGTGMDPSITSKIFEPFFSTKENGKGTGLGLSVVHGIIKQHGGWIQIESKPNSGTEFSIFLPSFRVKDQCCEHKKYDFERLMGNGECILLIEDEESVRKFARRALIEYGYRVVAAGSAQEAQKKFTAHENKFDMVLSDVVLPDMSGFDLINRFVQINQSIKVLLTSGYPDQKAQLRQIEVSGYNFIRKPYFLPELLTGVKNAFEKG